jgi:hypothetical protein
MGIVGVNVLVVRFTTNVSVSLGARFKSFFDGLLRDDRALAVLMVLLCNSITAPAEPVNTLDRFLGGILM